MNKNLLTACTLVVASVMPAAFAANTTSTKPAANVSAPQADVNLMTQIRERLTKDETLSVQAKNVQIVASNGQVTLTGTVPSKSEATAVERIASTVAGTGKVVNQLNVIE